MPIGQSEQAINARMPASKLIDYSDRGGQYVSIKYKEERVLCLK